MDKVTSLKIADSIFLIKSWKDIEAKIDVLKNEFKMKLSSKIKEETMQYL